MVNIKSSPHISKILTISNASEMHSRIIWEWRNDKVSRLMSRNKDYIHWETHKQWFEKSLLMPNRFLYVGTLENEDPVGVCIFDTFNNFNIAQVSINLSPKYRGQGLSVPLLSLCIKNFWEKNQIDLIATINIANLNSIKCFEKCGFLIKRSDNDYLHYNLSRQ